MKSFSYAAPKTLKDATALLGSEWGRVEILAGGTDLLTCLKQGITRPDRVVSLKALGELKGIQSRRGGLAIGAMTSLAELAAHPQIGQSFPAIRTALAGIGSPQILSVGTVGGDLCQRPRCWYFRNGFGLLARDGSASRVREGDHRYHAVFGTDGPALFVSASSLGPPLIALGAEVTLVGPGGTERALPAAQFFRAPQADHERETVLRPNEIVKEVFLPDVGLKNATYEVRHRHGLDWPYVTASVAWYTKGSATVGRVVLGHVAATPWLAKAAGAILASGALDEALAGKCAEAAVAEARPLPGNAYKVAMARTAVKRALMATMESV